MNIWYSPKLRNELSVSAFSVLCIMAENSSVNAGKRVVKIVRSEIAKKSQKSVVTVGKDIRELEIKGMISVHESEKYDGDVFYIKTDKIGIVNDLTASDAKTSELKAVYLGLVSSLEKMTVVIGGRIYNVWDEFVKSQEAQILENEEKIKVAKRNIDLLNSTRKNLLDLK